MTKMTEVSERFTPEFARAVIAAIPAPISNSVWGSLLSPHNVFTTRAVLRDHLYGLAIDGTEETLTTEERVTRSRLRAVNERIAELNWKNATEFQRLALNLIEDMALELQALGADISHHRLPEVGTSNISVPLWLEKRADIRDKARAKKARARGTDVPQEGSR